MKVRCRNILVEINKLHVNDVLIESALLDRNESVRFRTQPASSMKAKTYSRQ
jgi:hypothetical protein